MENSADRMPWFKQLYRRLLPLAWQFRLRDFPIMRKIQVVVALVMFPLLVLFLGGMVLVYFRVVSGGIADELAGKTEAARRVWQEWQRQTASYAAMIAGIRELQLENLNPNPNRGKIRRTVQPYLQHLGIARVAVYSRDQELLASAGVEPPSGKEITLSGNQLEIRPGVSDKPARIMLNGVARIRYQGEELGFVLVSFHFGDHLAAKLSAMTGAEIFFLHAGDLIASSLGVRRPGAPPTDWSGLRPDGGDMLNIELVIHQGEKQSRANLDLTAFAPKLDSEPEANATAPSASLDRSFLIALGNDYSGRRNFLAAVFISSMLLASLLISLALLVAYNIALGIGDAAGAVSLAMADIADRNFTRRIRFQAQDELGLISLRFNEMADRLACAYSDLEALNAVSQFLHGLPNERAILRALPDKAGELLGAWVTIWQKHGNLWQLVAGTTTPPAGWPPPDAEIDIAQLENLLRATLASAANAQGVYLINTETDGLPRREIFRVYAARPTPFAPNHAGLLASLGRTFKLAFEKIAKVLLEAEISTGAVVQKSLVPQTMPRIPGLEMHGIMDPAKGIGGDYFDFITDDSTDPPQLLTVIGDISGKGVAAGLLMVMVRTMLHVLTGHGYTPRELILRLNQLLHDNSESDKFLTMVLLLWNPHRRRLTVAGGGHTPLLWHRAAPPDGEEALVAIPTGGTLVGAMDNRDLPEGDSSYSEFTLPASPGDTILLYTDGLPEARDPRGQEFGDDRIMELARRYCDLPVAELTAKLYAEALAFADNAIRHDDITIVALRFTPLGALPDPVSAEVGNAQSRRWRAGLRRAMRATTVNPEDYHGWKQAGNLAYKLGLLADCRKFWLRALELRPDDPVLGANMRVLSGLLARTEDDR